MSGQITYSAAPSPDFELGTTAAYSCEAGFALKEGYGVRNCSGDGSSSVGVWTGTEPTCEGE